jgi:hypothetical protein
MMSHSRDAIEFDSCKFVGEQPDVSKNSTQDFEIARFIIERQRWSAGWNKMNIYRAYTESLLWVALLMALVIGVALNASLVFVDFVHSNPHRTLGNVLVMMVLFPPILGVVAIFGSFVVFTLPLCLQAAMSDILVRQFGRGELLGILPALPLIAILAWYCYDYLTPTDFNLGINTPPDWSPYQHGLTMQRYLTMLIVQTPITLFCLSYCDASIRHSPRKSVVVAALIIAAIVGVFYGHWMAAAQYKFL